MEREKIAKEVGCPTESLRRWYNEAKRKGLAIVPNKKDVAATSSTPATASATTSSAASSAPLDPGAGLGEHEVKTILDYKKKHPSMGPAQIRAQLKRFLGWRVSVKAIARVLRRAGFPAVHRKGRPVGQERPGRFEAPHRNALWQLDFTELRVGSERRWLLVIEDDFSQLIDHSLRTAYWPQGGGKIESVIGTVQRELWEVVHFDSVAEAEHALVKFFVDYNHRRAHLGIGSLVPADRFYGRWPEVIAEMDAVSRRRQGALALQLDRRLFVEPPAAGERVVALQLILVGDQAELHVSGRRVVLGKIEP